MLTLPEVPINVDPLASNPLVSSYDIIIADDEQAIAECIADVLSEEGYRVHAVHDGASALLAIEQYQPLLALLDVAMPVMNGDDVLAVVQRRFPNLPVVLMSAGINLRDFLAQGAASVLPKPFDLEQLLDCISTHTGRQATSRQLALGNRE